VDGVPAQLQRETDHLRALDLIPYI